MNPAAAIWGHDDRHLERGRGFAATRRVLDGNADSVWLGAAPAPQPLAS